MRPRPSEFGQILLLVRHSLGLSRLELAGKAHLSDATIKYIENGRHKKPSHSATVKLVRAVAGEDARLALQLANSSPMAAEILQFVGLEVPDKPKVSTITGALKLDPSGQLRLELPFQDLERLLAYSASTAAQLGREVEIAVGLRAAWGDEEAEKKEDSIKIT